MSRANLDRFVESTEAFNRFARAPDAFGRAEVEGWLRFYDPDIRFEPRQSALQGTYMGHDALRQWLADLAEHYAAGHLDFSDIRDLEDQVLGLGTLRVTGRGSGIEIDVPVGMVATFQEGLVTHLKDYGSRDQALEAVGLSE